MDRPMSDFHFTLMALIFTLRDWIKPPENVVAETGIKPGCHVLDYGCGPGSYSIAAATLTGASGKVYALDIHPLAIEKVQKKALKKGLKNIQVILSDRETGLKNASIDFVLLYDTFHGLRNPGAVLDELHRVLKADGFLSFSDHHMKEEEIRREITKKNLFIYSEKGKWSFIFAKA